MTRKSPEQYFAVALATVLFLVWFHAPISVGFSTLFPSAEQYIKAWKEIILGITFIAALVLVTKHQLWQKLLIKNQILQLILGLACLHVVLAAVLFSDWQAVLAGLVIDMRFLLAFSLTYVAVMLYPKARSLFIWTAVVGGGLTVLFGLLQLSVLPDDVLKNIGYSKETITPYTTIDKNTDFIRLQSTQRGPNPLGAVCAILLAGLFAFALASWRKITKNQRIVLSISLFVTALVLYATYSRSAYLAAAIAGLIVPGLVFYRKLSKQQIAVVLVGLFVALVGFMSLQQTDWYKNVVLHEDPESSETIKSNDQHVESLESGWKRLINQPFGAGIGSTGSASIVSEQTKDVTIENYYLFVGHETGWLGFIGFVALTVLVLRELALRQRKDWRAQALFASGAGLAIAALFLPVWADDTTSIVWWGLAGAVLASSVPSKSRKP